MAENSRPLERVGRYDLLAPIGRGAFGVVYRARDPVLDRIVAVKLVAVDDERAVEQFRREAQVAAKLEHPNLLRIFEVGSEDGRLFLVSPYIEGGSLAERLKRNGPNPIDFDEAVRIATDVGKGLSALHGEGIVHRDLKPSNILLDSQGRAVVADFGLALRRGAESQTVTGMVFGTVNYMSPEQVRGDAVDVRADLFVFGAVAYEMFTGHRPFESNEMHGVFHNILQGSPLSPERLNPSISDGLSAVLLRSMAKQAADRYQSADEFVAALRAAALPSARVPASGVRPASASAPARESFERAQDTAMMAPIPRPSSKPIPRVDDAPAWLLITNGERTGERIPVRRALTFGRDPSADVWLDRPQISRHHARIELRPEGCVLVDLQSANGVRVNDRRVDQALLQDGDQIELGDTILAFQVGAGHGEANPAVVDERLRRLDALWLELSAAVARADEPAFAEVVEQLVAGPLREAIGYRIDAHVPQYRGIAGAVVSNAMLWIRHSRFPIMFVAYDRTRDVLGDLVRQIELAKVGTYFAMIVVVPTEATRDQMTALRQSLRDTVYRYDFVVLELEHIRELVERGTARGLVQLIMDQGVDLGSLSPFVVRGPVPESMFFGREREVKQIAQSSTAYAVVGGRRIGKSSMLMKLKRLFSYDPGSEPIYLNCEDKFELEDFLAGMSDALEVADLPDLRSLRPALKAYRRKSGRRLVCLLDEVDELVARDLQDGSESRLLPTLRALAFEDEARFVLSGSRTLNRLGHDPKSPLFNFCEWMTVGMLDARSVEEIVTKPLEQLGFVLTDPVAIVSRMMVATGGHPNLVQWLCDRLVRTTSGQRISVATVNEAADNTAYHDHLVETIWGDATPVERLATLVVPAPEFSRADFETAMRGYGVVDADAVAEALTTLQLFSIVEGQSGQFRFINEEFLRVVRRTRDLESEIARLSREVVP